MTFVTSELLKQAVSSATKISDEERKAILNYIDRRDNNIAAEIVSADEGNTTPPISNPRSFAEIPKPEPEETNPRAIFRNGYGRKGHFAILVSVSGAGKSVGAIQQAYAWAKGEAGAFGVAPVRPLKIAYIGNEDDDEELFEIRENMRSNLKAAGWSDEDISNAESQIIDESASFHCLRGKRFAKQLHELLIIRSYDIVIVNPILSYFGANISNNEEVSAFFREDLDPVLKDPATSCMLLGIHHTTKPPPKDSRNNGWGTDAMAAYIGAGGAELVNYARAVLVLTPYESKGGSNQFQIDGYFRLVGAKRGKRLGWTDSHGNPSKIRNVAHSKDTIFWRVPTISELNECTTTPGPKIDPTEAKSDAHVLAQLLLKRPTIKNDIKTFAKGYKDNENNYHAGIFSPARGERASDYLLNNLTEFGLAEQKTRKNNSVMIGLQEQLADAVTGYLAGKYNKPDPSDYPNIHP